MKFRSIRCDTVLVGQVFNILKPKMVLATLLKYDQGRVFILYFLNLATLMYALFERIGQDENASQDEGDPCAEDKTTVIVIKDYFTPSK